MKAFGSDRVRVTPISETAEIGMAVGAAFAGYRPVVQLYMAEFMLVAMDQVVNEAPRFYGMTAGQVKVPIVLQAGYGFTAGWAGQHTGTIYGMFMGVPALKVVVPSTAADAKGLMTAAIRDDNPVILFHNYLLTLEHGDVPEGEHVVPIGEAAVRREGSDVTIVGIGWTVGKALAAAEQLAGDGVSAEVIDARSLAPLDTATILQSVEKTGRLVVVDQATRHASAAAIIAAEVASEGFAALKAPIELVTALDATIPYSEPMEQYLLPDEAKIVAAVQQVLGRARRGLATCPDARPPARRRRRPRAPALDVADPRLRGARRRADARRRGTRARALERRPGGGRGRRVRSAAARRRRVHGHRAHGHAIAKGAPLDRVMAELMGRAAASAAGSAARCTSSTSSTGSSARRASWAATSRSRSAARSRAVSSAATRSRSSSSETAPSRAASSSSP